MIKCNACGNELDFNEAEEKLARGYMEDGIVILCDNCVGIKEKINKSDSQIAVLCGFSGAGKDELAKKLNEEYGYNFVISTTTRPKRVGESQGNPYHFVTEEYFNTLVNTNKLIEHRKYVTKVNGVNDIWHYGVTEDEIEDDKRYVVVLDLLGLKEFKKKFGNRITSFFIDVDEKTRKERAQKRDKNFCEIEWNRRYEDDKKQFPVQLVEKEVDYIVENYDLESAFYEILSKITEKRML